MGGHPSGDQGWKKAPRQEGATPGFWLYYLLGFRGGSDKTVTFFSQISQQKLMVNVSRDINSGKQWVNLLNSAKLFFVIHDILSLQRITI